ncbi:hypothetical protein [Thermococcus sp. Bubb.Bath]|uniref:hypothetical protein n=1 Tax=Thermococcus sp. Bubb.Bath TaxID=1638242 RepID=UPI00143AED60|nr:hypothetical protein [Thermococcus sp. Bubb.Bath]NJF25177.1 hypothetical protein [Thermococcus sp. Bubb.Bath]
MINPRRYLASLLFPDIEASVDALNHRVTELSSRLERLEDKMARQDEEIKTILSKVDSKADSKLCYELSEMANTFGEELLALKSEVSTLRDKARFVEFLSSGDPNKANVTLGELASLVEHYIRRGFNRPFELKKAVGVPWEVLYAVLTYLKLTKRVMRVQDGGKVKWIPLEQEIQRSERAR